MIHGCGKYPCMPYQRSIVLCLYVYLSSQLVGLGKAYEMHDSQTPTLSPYPGFLALGKKICHI